jgi:CRISPR-associated exonuclease Cas4
MLWLIVALFIAGLALLWLAHRQRTDSGLPSGQVIYVDTHGWGKVERPLFDPHSGLIGKPDYLVRQGSRIIPVEVKSGRAPATPHDSHLLQLAAYCYLVEKEYGKRPAYGILHYANRTYRVDYTRPLEAELLRTLEALRSASALAEVTRSHQEASRCRACGYRSVCDQALESGE